MSDVSERFRAALGERSFGWLADALKDSGILGTSHSSLRGYADGSRSPSLEVVEVVSSILDVRPEWLAFGTGVPGGDPKGRSLEKLQAENAALRDVIAAIKAVVK